MHGYKAYQKQKAATPTRIDLVLQLYDRALQRLDLAAHLLGLDKRTQAATTLSQVQLIITALASGHVASDPGSVSMLQLYEFVGHKLTTASAEAIADARKILVTLRDGFEAARLEALRLEREGAIPPLDRNQAISRTA